MGSAAEAKKVTNYINAQDTAPLQNCFINMGHRQPSTKLQIDNTTIENFSKGTLKRNLSKSIGMRFYWLQDRKT